MKTKELSEKEPTVFIKNSNLDKYANKVLFADKVKIAKHLIKTAGLPKA